MLARFSKALLTIVEFVVSESGCKPPLVLVADFTGVHVKINSNGKLQHANYVVLHQSPIGCHKLQCIGRRLLRVRVALAVRVRRPQVHHGCEDLAAASLMPSIPGVA